MSHIVLKGMTWDHPRGVQCLRASNQFLIENIHVSVEWSARSLLAFGDQKIEELFNDFDLLVIDHPHVPDAVHANAVLAFEDLAPANDLDRLSLTSAGESHDSYKYQGKHWALAIDAAAQVSAFRPDKADGAPTFWSEVFQMASTGQLLWPYKPVDAFSTFATLMAQLGKPIANQGVYLDLPAAEEALQMMVELATLVPQWCAESNPVDVAELLSKGNDYTCAVALYGYSNYARSGFRPHLLVYDEVPSFDGRARGSQLGGAGIAVSSATSHPREATAAAVALALPELQASIYTENGGQPGNLLAWKSHYANQLTNNFFRNTLRTLEGAWTRPRLLGWPDVQHQSSMIIHETLVNRRIARDTIGRISATYEKFIKE